MELRIKSTVFKGLAFGLTSGLMAHLGMIVGLFTGTKSKIAIIGGLISLGIADSLSDAFGIHVSEQSDKKKKTKETWITAWTTLIGRFLFSLSFIVPFLLFSLDVAVIIGIMWGFFILILLSYFIAKARKISIYRMIGKNISIVIGIIIITYYAGIVVYNLTN